MCYRQVKPGKMEMLYLSKNCIHYNYSGNNKIKMQKNQKLNINKIIPQKIVFIIIIQVIIKSKYREI